MENIETNSVEEHNTEKETILENNEELLNFKEKQDIPQEKQSNKTSKSAIIDKIFQVCEQTDQIPTESKTTLKRMSKKKLQETLAGYIEVGLKRKIQQQMNVQPGDDEKQNQEMMALSCLRMAHDTVSRLTETCVQNFTPYTIKGFTDSLKQPDTSMALNECLLEIAREMDVMEHLSNPYTKLLLIWSGGIAYNLRKKQHQQINAKNMEHPKTFNV